MRYTTLFLLVFLSSSLWADNQACTPQRAKSATVHYVHDGDTLFLNDKRKIRIIGLNTPELARKHRPAEALAINARDWLRRILQQSQNRILLELDQQGQDKYGRTLAHLFLPNGQNITAMLLQKGLATTLVIPPNVRYWQCYRQAATKARERRLGLWALPKYQPITAAQLPPKPDGFFIIRDQIHSIHHGTRYTRILLGSNLALLIQQQDMAHFGNALKALKKGRYLHAQGWIHTNKKGAFMRIRHPTALEYK